MNPLDDDRGGFELPLESIQVDCDTNDTHALAGTFCEPSRSNHSPTLAVAEYWHHLLGFSSERFISVGLTPPPINKVLVQRGYGLKWGDCQCSGEAWPVQWSKDGVTPIFIYPCHEPDEALIWATLLHTLMHCVVGNNSHKDHRFLVGIEKLGLVKPAKHALPGPVLRKLLDQDDRRPPLPFGKSGPDQDRQRKPKKNKRLKLRVSCETCGPQYEVDPAQFKASESAGPILHGCGGVMRLIDPGAYLPGIPSLDDIILPESGPDDTDFLADDEKAAVADQRRAAALKVYPEAISERPKPEPKTPCQVFKTMEALADHCVKTGERFSNIHCDVPWDYGVVGGSYNTMRFSSLAEMEVGRRFGTEDGLIFMWMVDSMTEAGHKLMRTWGYEPKTKAFNWVKLNPSGRGIWVNKSAYIPKSSEICWLGIKGSYSGIERKVFNIGEMIFAPRRDHSQKPDEIYSRIETIFGGTYLDLFSRTSRPGWTMAGWEVGKYVADDEEEIIRKASLLGAK